MTDKIHSDIEDIAISIPEMLAARTSEQKTTAGVLADNVLSKNSMNTLDLFQYTLYINLENREDRLQHVKTELNKMGITGERINAIRMTDGAIGCSMSHIRCLETAKERNLPYVFICEDDIFFLNPELLRENVVKFSKNTNIHWDVLIIGGNNCPPYKRIDTYCIQIFNNQTTTGYIVKSHYYDTMIDNFRESVKHLLREPHNRKMYALDIYWKRLQQTGSWYMITPPTVIQIQDYSDIEQKVTNFKKYMLDYNKAYKK
jgi:hypothetical protein